MASPEEKNRKDRNRGPTQTLCGFGSATAVTARVASGAATENLIAKKGIENRMYSVRLKENRKQTHSCTLG
jgi:hypothetical protein